MIMHTFKQGFDITTECRTTLAVSQEDEVTPRKENEINKGIEEGRLKIIVERFAYSLARTTDENRCNPSFEMPRTLPRDMVHLREHLACSRFRNFEYRN
jgi:hypothetical protein